MPFDEAVLTLDVKYSLSHFAPRGEASVIEFAREVLDAHGAAPCAAPSYPDPQALSAFDHVAFDRAILALSKESTDLRHHDGLRMACARLANHLRSILALRNAGVKGDTNA